MKKPNLFVVGAPKCGTTSMHYYLSQHPEIFMSEPKELHYMATDLIKSSVNYNKKLFYKFITEKGYLNVFKNVKDEKIIGESSPIYFFSKEAPKNIFKFNPNSKIIIMLRNPVDFMFSLHGQMIFSGDENIRNFENALKVEKERKKGKKLPRKVKIPDALFYQELSHYSKYINNYLSFFNRKNIKILFLEDLKKNPSKEYKEVLKFLGLDDIDFKPNFEIKNPRGFPRFMFFQNFLENPNLKIKRIMWKILPEFFIKKIYYTLLKLNLKRDYSKINPSLKRKLMKKYKSEVINLNNLLHKKGLIDKDKDLLKLWDYDKI